jgi:DNA (cytosine-5)-methyltransferase 1
MTYGSVCSGIEAATVAWSPLGWTPAWFAEIDSYCSKLLKHHYPTVINHGDFTEITQEQSGYIDLLCGGTPCQSFSVAGRRGGLEDARGNLAIEFCHLAGRLRPRWIVWENVPGVLSSNGGRDFGSIIGALAELGYGCAWRVLDAQFLGVPQRRRRVFVVGHLGDWRRAAAVLLERESLCRDTPARRKAREEVAGSLGGGTGERGWCNDLDRSGAFVSMSLNAKGGSGRLDGESETFVAHTLRGDGCDASEDGTGRGTPLVPTAVSGTLAVRRLTPRECERLQGFSDDYTLIPTVRKRQAVKGAKAEKLLAYYHRTERGRQHVEMRGGRVYATSDSHRYKALGNTWAVPVVRWIGERIEMVERMK